MFFKPYINYNLKAKSSILSINLCLKISNGFNGRSWILEIYIYTRKSYSLPEFSLSRGSNASRTLTRELQKINQF